MNLITKTTLIYLFAVLVILSVGGVLTYYGVENEVKRETDFDLRFHFRQLSKALEEGIPASILLDDRVHISEVSGLSTPQDTIPVYSDTLAQHPYLPRQEMQRKVVGVKEVKGKFYRIQVMDVFIESDDIYEGVVQAMTRFFLFLGGALLLLSFLIARFLFRPFQKTLEKIRTFDLKKDAPLQLTKTSTREFRQLNAFVEQMVDKARRDYRSVKEFSENASHEMQTPLAIARGKLELLLETENLDTEQTRLIQSAQQSLGKLSKLGEALALLTKIDNKEFATQAEVDFSKIVKNCLVNFEDLAQLKNLEFKKQIEEHVRLRIDPVLGDILVSNLVKNTIRHNIEGGWIEVSLTGDQLVICNTGAAPKVQPDQLFERFQKGAGSNKSLGLGLAIVKKICEVNNYKIDYQFADGVHLISVHF